MKRMMGMLLMGFVMMKALPAQELPHVATPEEKKAWPAYLDALAGGDRSVPAKPPFSVRTAAEWEPVQALVLTWSGQQAILREITRHAVKECKVIILTNNPANVSTQLTTNGIPLDSVVFLQAPYNSIWVRDYGPWTVYDNAVDSLRLIDWIYNRPRPQDDATPKAIAQLLGLPIHEAVIDPDDLVHTGGNHLTDGRGTAFSSMLVLDENPDKAESRIDSIASDYLGVDRYVKLPTLPYDGIHHLDMHMAILDEETILFGEYPTGVADGPQIESNLQYVADEYRTTFGNPYRIVRIPMPPDQNGRYPHQGGNYRTYTNSIFINKTILVPTYEERYDTTALRIYREQLPGYTVVGINCNAIIPSLGALHCITKTIGVSDPLWISHASLRDIADTVPAYPVSAEIRHRTGIASATLRMKANGDSIYAALPMTLSDTANSTWTATMPAYPAGTEVQYYIEAVAQSGRTQVRPLTAPAGYFKFRVLGEPANQPPTVVITSPPNGAILPFTGEPVHIMFDASDEDGFVGQAVLRIDGDSVAATEVLPHVFTWLPVAPGSHAIRITVKDDDGAEASSALIHVTLEASTGVQIPGLRSLTIYPNPASDVILVQTQAERSYAGEIRVFDMLGREQLVHAMRVADGWRLNIAGLSPGIYGILAEIGGRQSIGAFTRR